jgi:hypothetical protein
MDLAQAKGASAIVTTLPLKSESFFLHRSDYCDVIDMRYGWTPLNLPEYCPCGARFSLNHAQICTVGGFKHMRHDNVRDTFAQHASIVYNDVESEPKLAVVHELLKPLRSKSANIEDDSRSDCRINGFWTRDQSAFFDT